MCVLGRRVPAPACLLAAPQHLAWPVVQHGSVMAAAELEVHVMHIHDSLAVPRRTVNLNMIKVGGCCCCWV